MADKSLRPESIPGIDAVEGATPKPSSEDASARRAFLRKAAMIGVPVLLASIPSRTTWAQPNQRGRRPRNAEPALEVTGGACMASVHPSGCATRSQSLF